MRYAVATAEHHRFWAIVIWILVLEISTHDYGVQNDRLVEKIQNGRNNAYRKCGESSAEIYTLGVAGKCWYNKVKLSDDCILYSVI